MRLHRHNANPILEPGGDDWESVAVFNPAAIYKDGRIHLFYRAVGDYTVYASRLGGPDQGACSHGMGIAVR